MLDKHDTDDNNCNLKGTTSTMKSDFKKEISYSSSKKLLSRIALIFGASILIVFASIYIYETIENLNEPVRSLNKDYNWPCVSDFLHLFWQLPLTIFSKLLIERISRLFANSLISSRYKNPDGSLTEEAKIYSSKIQSNTFKTVYNLFITIFGYYVLSQLKYYPKELLGNGDINRIFEDKFPNFYFHHKPKFFDFLYMMNLCYYMTDMIWLIWISEPTCDYNLMIIHHISTIMLIFFSYWTNNSNIGSIIFYLHNIGNVFVYVTRVFMYSELSSNVKGSMTVTLLTVWIYTRLYVFAKLILIVWYELIPWNIVIYALWPLAVVLYFLHVYWVYEISNKLVLLMKTNIVEDVSKVKKR